MSVSAIPFLGTDDRPVPSSPNASDAEIHPSREPLIWLLLSDKTGDNAQLMAVAEELPWAYQIKRVTVREPYKLGKPKIAGSLHHIDQAQSDALQPPWPDLVIAIGRRMSMVALWIQEQSRGRTKIALLGPPKGLAHRFDLAVVSEQYRQSRRANLLRIRYPLQRVDEAAISAEAEAWRGEFAALPKPLIAVMIGGLTKAVRFDAAIARRLALDLVELLAREGGSLVITTSRRTPPEVTRILKDNLPSDAILYDWSLTDGRNPYRALLGLADRFVVTSDSLSMAMEVARLGRPLAIYRLPSSSWLAGRLLARFTEGNPERERAFRRILRPLTAVAECFGFGHHRDLEAIPRLLTRDGFAVWFGESFKPAGRRPPDELPLVVERIVLLIERQELKEGPVTLRSGEVT
jgi:mitochondrial fission protein ELM1